MKEEIGYTTFDLDFYIKKLKFDSTDISTFSIIETGYIHPARGKVASCYKTVKNYIFCLIMLKDASSTNLYAYAFDSNLTQIYNTNFGYFVVATDYLYYPYFIKCLHLKEEIGVFSFYRASEHMIPNPILLFKEFRDNILVDYISEIRLDKKEFNYNSVFNDLIRLNDKKLCYISNSENKAEMYIVLLNIYGTNNLKLAIRYYTINIFSQYTFKFYKNLRANPYNNYISFAFSYCRNSICKSENNEHYPGFMIFSYANGTDHSEDLIKIMYLENKKIDNYLINLEKQVKIENNIFGLISDEHEFKIKQHINCALIDFVSSQTPTKTINSGEYLNFGEYLIAKSIPIQKLKCSINYFYYITEPEYLEYNNYPTHNVFPEGYGEAFFNQEKASYESRLLYYNLTINEELSDFCHDPKCLVCKYNNRNYCIVCQFDYIENQDVDGIFYKTCAEEGINVTHQINVKETEPIIIEEEVENESNNYEAESIKVEQTNKVSDSNKIDDSSIIIINNLKTDESILSKTNSFEYECNIAKILLQECPNIKLNGNQIKQIYNQIKKQYFSGNYNGQSKVISTENVIFHISTFEYQKDNSEPNVSSIDLGICEDTLKGKYNISINDSLIVFKIDTKNEDKSQTYVHYEIYDPYNYQLLNLSLCENKIIINTPIYLDNNSIILYENLNKVDITYLILLMIFIPILVLFIQPKMELIC